MTFREGEPSLLGRLGHPGFNNMKMNHKFCCQALQKTKYEKLRTATTTKAKREAITIRAKWITLTSK
jgi:hypothetical protein